jgi:hypothetical protein
MNPIESQGAELLVACPNCHTPLRLAAPGMGSLEGSVVWSDGYRFSPLMPVPPRIYRCSSCAGIAWVNSSPTLGYLLPDTARTDENAEWFAAPPVGTLDEAGFLEALSLAREPEAELELRVASWWRSNDPCRVSPPVPAPPRSDASLENLRRIVDLTADGDETLLLFRAEALRHLGRFDEVAVTLEGVYCSDFSPAKSKQLEWASQEDNRLYKLFESLEFGVGTDWDEASENQPQQESGQQVSSASGTSPSET